MKWHAPIIAITLGASLNVFSANLNNLKENLVSEIHTLSIDLDQIQNGRRIQPATRSALQSIDKLKKILSRMENTISTADSSPIPPRGAKPLSYSAVCHIDNDATFTYDENIVGVFRADSIQEILEDCKSIAKSTYGHWSTSGLKDIQYHGPLNAQIQSSTCHIDNDATFTYNEYIVGQIVGENAAQITQTCKEIATATFGHWSTSGIMNLNENQMIPRRKKSATCHIDDDGSMTFNEYVVGIVTSDSIEGLTSECRTIAQATFGHWSTSGLRDFK